VYNHTYGKKNYRGREEQSLPLKKDREEAHGKKRDVGEKS